jgi:hypothetical protein
VSELRANPQIGRYLAIGRIIGAEKLMQTSRPRTWMEPTTATFCMNIVLK